MSRPVTLGEALTRIYRRADLESATDRFPRAEVVDEYNESLAALYDRMLRARGPDYFEKSAVITTDGVAMSFDLPADFLELLSVELTANGKAGRLRAYDREQRPDIGVATGFLLRGKSATSPSDTIELLPLVASGARVEVFYVPSAPKLVLDADTFDGVSGWEEYAILDTAAKLLLKNNKLDRVATLRAMREDVGQRIDALAPRRNASGPAQVVNVRRSPSTRGWRRTP